MKSLEAVQNVYGEPKAQEGFETTEARLITYWLVEKSALYQVKTGYGPDRETLKDISRRDRNYPGDHMVDKYYNDNYRRACAFRGIQFHGDELSPKQNLTIALMTDLSDTRPIKSKLKQLGVTQVEFGQWMAYPVFQQRYREYSHAATEATKLIAQTTLNSMVADGNLNAIKYFDQRTGEFDPERQKNVDVMVVIQGVIEIIQTYVTDPAQRQRIAGAIGELAQKQLTGSGLNLGGGYASSAHQPARVVEAGGA